MAGAVATGPLLERSADLARIELALADARAGRGRFVVVEGPAGIGKTALLGAVRGAAAESGMRVLRSRGSELEREFAFGIVRQVFEPPLAEATAAVRAELLQAAAGEAAGLLGLPGAEPRDGPSAEDPSFALLHGLYWLCANLAAGDPLCVIVDDAHWADAPSLRYLAFLLTRLEELAVALVVATRPHEVDTDAALLATVTNDRSAEVIRLPPLTGAAVAELLEARLSTAPDPVFVAACLQSTRGTPLLVRELAEALAEASIAPSADAASHVEEIGARTIGRSVSLHLSRLPEPAARLARALAVLERSDLLRAAQLAELDPMQAAEAAEALVAGGILEPGLPLQFVHPIVRSSLYAELPATERARTHRAVARMLGEQRGTDELIAQHLLVVDPSADEWVVERLVAAARAATRSGASEPAAVFLRRALAEPPPSADQPGLLLELGLAEENGGLEGWKEHLQEAVDLAPNPAAAAGAARVLARALNRAQHFEQAVEVLDRAASELDDGQADLALHLEAAAVVIGMNDLTASRAVAFRRTALRERVAGDRTAPHEVLAAAGYISILTNEPAEVGAELALRALRTGEDTEFAFATMFARTSLSLLLAERYASLVPLLDASIAHARLTGDGGLLAVALADRSWLALRRGDLPAAEDDAGTALSATAFPAPPMYRVLNSALLVEALVEQDRLGEAELVLGPLGEEADGRSLTAAVLRFARGRLRVAEGRVAEGLDDLLGVGLRLTRARITCPSLVPWRSEAALAQLALGTREPAARLADEELDLARVFGAPRALGVASRAAGVVAGGERGELLLRDAVAAFEHAGARLERARAQADLGAMLRRRNRRTDARELLRDALDAAHRAGALRLAEYAGTELRATGARPRRVVLSGVESLTASERRIAELADQGLTNREIAQMLFVTARTVEGHLTSVFRKLRIDSRKELHGALAGHSAGAP